MTASSIALSSLSVSSLDGFSWIEPAWAIAALARTSMVALPAKLLLGRGQIFASVRVETIDLYATPDFEHTTAAEEQYLQGIPLETGCRTPELTPRAKPETAKPLSFPDGLSEALADALEATEWTLSQRAKAADPATTPLRAAPPWAATSFVTIAPAAAGFVRVALGVDVIRAEHERARTAVGLFALQAGGRLLLARATLGSAKARNDRDDEQLTIGWDAVIPVVTTESSERAVRAIAQAAAACEVARRLTLESFRALAQSEALADAYFASDSRFESFRSIGTGKALSATTANTNTEENDACRPQPQL